MKTIEDKAKAYATNNATVPVFYTPDVKVDISKQIKLAYLAGATEALSGQWRSVKEELPKDGDTILIYYKYRESGRLEYKYSYMQVEYNAQNGFNLFENNLSKWGCKVLFWIPIPEPPKDESE